MQNHAILHSDLNCFYASVETMLDPSLRGKAVAVCGCTEDRHGIVLAKSELAKKAGVKTGMVNWEAKQCCRDLIIVPPQYDQYLKYSKLTQAIYQRYTDMVEPFGMDECWLDVTGSRCVCGDARTIAENIRCSVKEELGLTVSIGVSFNKVFAKLGSDLKKPDAITEISPESYKEKVWPLPCSDMIYCGPATTKKLAQYGIHTIGEVAGCDPLFLKGLLGVNGLALWTYANGRDHSRVMHKDFVSPVKSVGHGITCVSDLETKKRYGKSYSLFRRISVTDFGCITSPPVPSKSMSEAMICSAHSINASCRSRLSFPRRSPLPHFGVLKSGIPGTRRSERSPSVPLNSRPKTVRSNSRCLIMSSTAWQWRKSRTLWRRSVVALARAPSPTPASWAI